MTNEDQIARYGRKRDRALAAVRSVDEEPHVRHEDCDYYPPRDVTAEWRETKLHEAEILDRLLTAAERHGCLDFPTQ
jgi:hypothetical protein